MHRHDPDALHRRDRGRHSGHPGTPTGARALDPEYEILGEPAVGLDDPKRFRQLGSKCPLGWARYVGDRGAIVAMNTFGASAPLKELVAKFGFTPHAVTEVARGVLR